MIGKTIRLFRLQKPIIILPTRFSFCVKNSDSKFDENLSKPDQRESVKNTAELDIEKERLKFREKLTDEEFNLMTEIGNEEIVFQMKDKNKGYFQTLKKIALYFNIPFSLIALYVGEVYFAEMMSTTLKGKVLFGFCVILDYTLLVNALLVLFGMRGFIGRCVFLPKENALKMTKFTITGKEYDVIKKKEELSRVMRTPLSPFLTFKDKKTNEIFSMYGLGKWENHKLFNYLYPPLESKRRPMKHPLEKRKL